ncbi:hypothetical protein ABBQ38_010573 [Trebouxia sp. C0009 RCD-2024]
MVKKKGGRDINPADAFRKTQRAKEIARNKKERKFQRDAFALKAQPDQIRNELAEVLDKEEDGKVLNQTLRLKKRALQSAYDAALKKRKEDDMRDRMPDQVSLADPASGTGIRRAEDSVYYHPSINPLGLPPAGKPQRYRTSVLALEGPAVSSAAALPVPKPPPLPQGPAPQLALLPPPGLPETSGQQTSGLGSQAGAANPLPPPDGPPPGVGTEGSASAGPMPPPLGPPPGVLSHPPSLLGPPHGMMMHQLPGPTFPPPGYGMAVPPLGPPPSTSAATKERRKDTQSTFTGQATVVKMPKANEDKTVTSMVPASVRVRREQAANAVVARPRSSVSASAVSGFGLMPTSLISRAVPAVPKPAVPSETDAKYQDFLAEMNALGAMAS